MKILSFDVGIRNLAYCLFEVDTETKFINNADENKINNVLNSIHIIDWSVINLTTDEKDKICNMKNKNGKFCKNKALYKYDDIYYCKKHATESKYLIPSRENSIQKIKKMKKNEIIKYCKHNFINHEENKQKIYYINLIELYLAKNCLKSVHSVKADNMSLVSIGRTMNKKFEEIFENKDVDIVLIENQISPIANRMKTIQGMITQYFIMKNIECIEFISSSNKLKLFTNIKTNYKERKKYGIEIMNTLVLDIIDNGKWKDLFSRHKKKDDLADAFLQSLYYVQMNILN